LVDARIDGLVAESLAQLDVLSQAAAGAPLPVPSVERAERLPVRLVMLGFSDAEHGRALQLLTAEPDVSAGLTQLAAQILAAALDSSR
jgi:hypothetical protein